MPGSKAKKNDLFNALGHPMRRQILRTALDTSDNISPSELAAKLQEDLSAVSYHVRVLAQCDAIESVDTEQIYGSTQHFYRFTVKADWALAALEADE
jgi:DNA-binding transcriptional ArsR family regulator